MVLFLGNSGNFYCISFLELNFETKKSSLSKILQFFAFALHQITVILLEHRSQVTWIISTPKMVQWSTEFSVIRMLLIKSHFWMIISFSQIRMIRQLLCGMPEINKSQSNGWLATRIGWKMSHWWINGQFWPLDSIQNWLSGIWKRVSLIWV